MKEKKKWKKILTTQTTRTCLQLSFLQKSSTLNSRKKSRKTIKLGNPKCHCKVLKVEVVESLKVAHTLNTLCRICTKTNRETQIQERPYSG